ncbi:hypothetical protein [Microbacterium sp. cf332]|uniref:hypothetical protein n=1 Tax=Microbacterium sp. cf332 TaxID=1761804 RepID=UPI000882E0E7|nr:hypothetical protein [Microbacterium sp. cf332]SDQ11207.1 hypothetical protein SAMN04487847_0408 [Microbacterium sp. cf332]
MIIERPLLGTLSIQLFAEDIREWEDWTAELQSLTIQRGGKRNGVAVSVDPGTLTATIVNAGDPASDGRIHPNARVRVGKLTGAGDLLPIFTGRIADVFATVTFEKTSGARTLRVTLSAVDSVTAHANTTRYGVISDPETWAQRITRLADSALTEVVLPEDDSPLVRTL